MENIAKEGQGQVQIKSGGQGQGLADTVKSFAKKTGLEKESKKLLKQVLSNLSDAVDIKETKDGSGLYLSPKLSS